MSQIAKMFLINQLYRELDAIENNEKIKDTKFTKRLKVIGEGVYTPSETQMKTYGFLRQTFIIKLYEDTVYFKAIAIPQIEIFGQKHKIFSDESVRLGTNLIALKILLGFDRRATNFQIITRKNNRLQVSSVRVNQRTLDLSIGSHQIKFCWDLTVDRQPILLYASKFDGRIISRFDDLDDRIRAINARIIEPLILNPERVFARQFDTINPTSIGATNFHSSKAIEPDALFSQKPKNSSYSNRRSHPVIERNLRLFRFGSKRAAKAISQRSPLLKNQRRKTKFLLRLKSLKQKLLGLVERMFRLIKISYRFLKFFLTIDFLDCFCGRNRIIASFKSSLKMRSTLKIPQRSIFFKALKDFLFGLGDRLSRTDYRNHDFSNDVFVTDYIGYDFSKAIFYQADLSCFKFMYSNFTKANFVGANLSDADFRYADLRGADLKRANLRGGDLRGADLRGADLRDADFTGADLRGAKLDHISFD